MFGKLEIDLKPFQTIFGGTIKPLRSEFVWILRNKKDIHAFLDYYKTVEGPSIKSRKLLLVQEHYSLLGAWKPDSIDHARWLVLYDLLNQD